MNRCCILIYEFFAFSSEVSLEFLLDLKIIYIDLVTYKTVTILDIQSLPRSQPDIKERSFTADI
jgi:hypothetical protein